MSHRDKFLSVYYTFAYMIHTQFDSPISFFGVVLLVSIDLQPFAILFYEQGTLFQYSCIDTQAQNGVTECKHRHLTKTVRTLLIASHVPLFSGPRLLP